MRKNLSYWESALKNLETDYKSSKGIEFIFSSINTGDKILEAGCGQGRIVFKLAYRGYEVFGIDFSRTLIEKCKMIANKTDLIPENHFKFGNILNIPFKDENFDVYISIGVIEHFKLNEQKKVIIEARRVLKMNGKVIISVPNFYSPNTVSRIFIKWIKKRIFKEYMIYQKNISTKKIKSMFEMEGFRTINCYNYGLDKVVRRLFLLDYSRLLMLPNFFRLMGNQIIRISRYLEKYFCLFGEKTVYIGIKEQNF